MTNQSENRQQTLSQLIKIAHQFQPRAKINEIKQHGSGNINSTYLVIAEQPFILQRLNTKVFCQPKLVMDNICILSEHVQEAIKELNLEPNQGWLMPKVLLTQYQQHHYLGEDGSFWRGISYVENSLSFDTIQNLHHAQEVGFGLGMFHRLLDNLPVESLADTLVGFHITPQYLKQYQQVFGESEFTASREIQYCTQFISDRPKLPYVLEAAKGSGKLKLRIIHGDPKINNIMIDRSSHKAVAMIDLDTVKPGLIHYDIGDCLRSGCNPLGEETEDWSEVYFEPKLAAAILKGYLNVARDFLTPEDYDYIFDSIRLLAFELGLRFFTDYLAGNVYFSVSHSEHNLARALVQFKLTESIEQQEVTIKKIINSLR
ncbi:MAG: aminoglycoside phosphotransferase family protein [Cyanobacteria bacterium J06621_8]